MHKDKRAEKITGRGPKDKTIVMGVLERRGEVRVAVVPTRRKGDVQGHVREHALAGSALFTDALKSYDGLTDFQHEVIDHAVEYVRGEVHTNGMENFWSLLKRGLNGTYVSVEPFHLFRYLDEQAFRYNQRHGTDAGSLQHGRIADRRQALDLCRTHRQGVANIRRLLLNGRVGGNGRQLDRFPLRPALSRVRVGLLFVLRFAPQYLCFWHGHYVLHGIREGFVLG